MLHVAVGGGTLLFEEFFLDLTEDAMLKVKPGGRAAHPSEVALNAEVPADVHDGMVVNGISSRIIIFSL